MDNSGNSETETKLRDYLKRVTAELSHTRQRLKDVENAGSEPIAIVGMACRLPGGIESPKDLWDAVEAGIDTVGPFPTDRGWRLDDADTFRREAAFIEDVADFDNTVFGLTPREALGMDPQQRLFLESSWEAIERAGIDAAKLAGRQVGVFAGAVDDAYISRLDDPPETVKGYKLTGTSVSVISGRVAYCLGLEGPAVSVDTACSSSLTALHLAAQSLRRGECELALAGGVNVLPSPLLFEDFSRQGGLAADGRIKPFSAQADGTNWSEGVGVLLVERLSDALRHKRPVLAVLRGSAINQDGASNGLTAPNDLSQERVIRAALADAQLQTRDVDAIEAHGTGTPLGDPLEAKALLATYGQDRSPESPFWIGSVKSNLGHSGPCAGMTSVIKMVEAMRHGVLPKTLHVGELSSNVDWTAGAVDVLTQQIEWPAVNRPRRAAVSGFGISGTNAHLVLEAGPTVAEPSDFDQTSDAAANSAIPWVLSGKTAVALRQQAQRLLAHITGNDEVSATDLAYTLATARVSFKERAVVVGSDLDDLRRGLRAIVDGVDAPGLVFGRENAGKLGFLFTGQGSQRLGMGKELYATYPSFSQAIDDICSHMDLHLEHRLRDVMFGDDPELINKTAYTQPALFAIELALFRLLESWGIKPDYLNGHSIGELTAAHVAGVLSLADACALVAARGSLMQGLPPGGAMVAVAASETEARPLLNERVDIAAINGPNSIVLSGDEEAVSQVVADLESRGRKTKRLTVSHAFHSPRMEPMMARFRTVAQTLSFHPPAIPLVSNLTGEAVSRQDLCDPDFWVQHVRRAVRFCDGARSLAAADVTTFIEVGPGGVLTAAAQDCITDDSAQFIPALRSGRGEAESLALAVAQAHIRGTSVDWEAYFAGAGARKVELPTYAFQRQRFWAEEQTTTTDVAGLGLDATKHGLLGAAIRVAGSDQLLFTGRLSASSSSWLLDHAVGGAVLLPGTGFVDMALHVGMTTECPRVAELTLQTPLIIPSNGAVRVQVTVDEPDDNGYRSIAIYSKTDGHDSEPWACHAFGSLCAASPTVGENASNAMQQWPPADAEPLDISGLYSYLAERGYQYGPAFQGLVAAWRRDDEIFSEVSLPARQAEEVAQYGLHPALLDTALHGALLALINDDMRALNVPFMWTGVELSAAGARRLRVHCRLNDDGMTDVRLIDDSGQLIASATSLVMRELSGGTQASARSAAADLITADWVPMRAAVQNSGTSSWKYIDDGSYRIGELPDPVPEIVVVSPDVSDGGPEQAIGDAVSLIQEWLSDERSGNCLLAFALKGDSPNNAAIAGLVRSALSENPDRFGLIHTDGYSQGLQAAVNILASGEPEVRIRAGELAVQRLKRRRDVPHLELPQTDSWCLGAVDGRIDVVTAEASSTPLNTDQVRIQVKATGLNFRDVVVAMDMVDGFESRVGLEGAGVINEVGSQVTRFAVGDRVMGLLNESMAPVAIGNDSDLTAIPNGWTYAQAGSIPLAFLTTWLSLTEIACVKPGERVLVHSGTGGVGLAAIQVAQYLGAEVFATASPAKQYLLRELGLDSEHIASTRTLDFREHFLATTDGSGVDVVLNTLAGEFTDATLALCSRAARFVELGKTDVRDPATVAADYPGVSYKYFDLGDYPHAVAGAWQQLMPLFAADSLRPLRINTWPIWRAPEAVDRMQRAQHLGKIVFTMPTGWDPDKTVLITGGTGTLGGLLAKHLVTQYGVTNLVLSSRRGLGSPGADELVHDLEAEGASVQVASCDASDKQALASLISQIPPTHPLGSVVHMAGVTEDTIITSLTSDQLSTVVRAKAVAAANLNELTAGIELDNFMMFSSAAGTLGSAGQANYAAANAYLDGLAINRRHRGLPAVSMAWGMWERVSDMTGHLGRQDLGRLSRLGIESLKDSDGLALFDAAREVDEANVVTMRMNSAALVDSQKAGALPPVMRDLVPKSAAKKTVEDSWRYGLEWRKVSLDHVVPSLSGAWVVLVSRSNVNDPLVARVCDTLTSHGASIELKTVDANTFERADFAKELRPIVQCGDNPKAGGGILSLLALDTSPHAQRSDIYAGAMAGLALAQAIVDIDCKDRLWMVTQGGAITGDADPKPRPSQGLAWGLGREFAAEQVQRWGMVIDVPETLDASSAKQLARTLSWTATDEDGAAIRESGAYVRRLVKVPSKSPSNERNPQWNPNGTVLVTGGLGGLGIETAEWLARMGAEHLLLSSRQGPNTPGAEDIRTRLEKLGASVSIVACDVSQRSDVANLLRQVPADRPLSAVFHSAGVFQTSATIADLSAEAFADCVSGKVTGAEHLDEALRGTPLDAFVLYSSCAGICTVGAQAAYAAGNAALDVLAHARRARGETATSIAWGVWGGAGMVANAESGQYMERIGLMRMDPAAAISHLEPVLSADETAICVAAFEWDRFAVELNAVRPRPLLLELPQAQRALGQNGPTGHDGLSIEQQLVSSTSSAERKEILFQLVRDNAAAVLLLDAEDVPADQTFRDLGFDSLTAVELRNKLNKATGLRLPASVAFDYPTVAELIGALDAALPPVVSSADTPAEPAQVNDQETVDSQASQGGLTTLLRTAANNGRLLEARQLAVGLASLRAELDDTADFADRQRATVLNRGAENECVVVCLPSFIGRPNPFHYAELAKNLPAQWPVVALELPGYRDGEPLPASLDTVIEVLAHSTREAVGDNSYILIGHSGGGLIASKLTERMERDGEPPEGLVMLDSPEWDPSVSSIPKWFPRLYQQVSLMDEPLGEVGESWITAEARYTVFDYGVSKLATPTLVVRATDMLDGLSIDETGWQIKWDLPHVTAEVPGDHFTMLQQANVHGCAQVMSDWIESLPRQREI